MRSTGIVRGLTAGGQPDEDLGVETRINWSMITGPGAMSERVLAHVLHSIGGIILFYDLGRGVLTFGGGSGRLGGHTVAELSALARDQLLALLHPDDVARIGSSVGAAVVQSEDGGVHVAEVRIRDPRGAWRWLSVHVGVWERDAAGSTTTVLAVAHDVHDAKVAREHHVLQTAALAAAGDAVLITDAAGTIQWVNQAFLRLYGYEADEVVGRTPRVLSSGRHGADVYERVWRAIGAGSPWLGEFVNRCKDGTLRTVETCITPVRLEAREVTHFVAVQRDLTERRHLEQDLRRSREMEVVGRIAGDVAHDFNNLLTTVLGYTGMLIDDMPAEDPRHQDLIEIWRAADRAAALARQLLAASRRPGVSAQAPGSGREEGTSEAAR